MTETEQKPENFIKKYRGEIIAWTVITLCPAVLYLAVEYMDNNNPFTSLPMWKVWWNIAWYAILMILVWTITGRRRISAISISILMFLFGLTNHYVLRFRGRALFPTDIMTAKTAANVADAFDFTPDKYIYIAAAGVLAYIILVLFTKKEKKRASWKIRLPFACALVIFFTVFYFSPLLPHINLYAQQWVTNRSGFILNFNVSLHYSFVQKPEDYSKSKVHDIQNDILDDLTIENGAETPTNIIVIMNESFADLSIFDNFSATCDPLEFYHSLTENTVKGYIYSPVKGGGTANVEYEYLTGNATSFLPEGTVVYQLYLDENAPSYARLAKELGYRSYAFHPYLASGWNRITAYEQLGFDEQLYVDDVLDPQKIRDYISDAGDYDTIKKIESGTKDKTFFFNVTMQNHSGYSQGWNNLEKACRITMEGDYNETAATQYLSLVDASDEALEELIDYYNSYEEPTLIVMFGDHQPPLGDGFYDALFGKPEDSLTPDEIINEYLVPFFIWANYDIEEKSDIEISANYLGLLMAEAANMPETGYMKLLHETIKELPVIHTVGLIDADGIFHENENDLSEARKNILNRFRNTSYYTIFDFDEKDDKAFYYYNN